MSSPKPSGFGAPEAHAAMDAALEAEVCKIEKQLVEISRQLHETFVGLARLEGLRPQLAVVAAIETAANSAATASMMCPNPTEALAHYKNYFGKRADIGFRTLSPFVVLLKKADGAPSCSNDLSSEAQPSSSSSTSVESPPSSSGESKDA